MKLVITEEEKNNILNRYSDNIDEKIYNFLIRRSRITKRNVSWGGNEPFIVTEVVFDGLPGYGFTTFKTKKQIVNNIYNMLEENGIIDLDRYEMEMRDFQQASQNIIRSIRKFVDFVLEFSK